MTDASYVTWACLLAGAVSFVLYVCEAFIAITAKPAAAVPPAAKAKIAELAASPDVSVSDVTNLLTAMSKLTDSLAKAGPGLTSLVGAILFFAIAALSSGALHGGAQPAAAAAPPVSSAPAQ